MVRGFLLEGSTSLWSIQYRLSLPQGFAWTGSQATGKLALSSRFTLSLITTTKNRKSPTGLPKDPSLAAYGEVHIFRSIQALFHVSYFVNRLKQRNLLNIFYLCRRTNAQLRYSRHPIVRHMKILSARYINTYTRFPDRCLQTAQPVSEASGLSIYVEHGSFSSPAPEKKKSYYRTP